MSYIQFYAEYLDLVPSSDEVDFAPCRCVFHDDSQASAGISKKTGVYNCFVCGSFSPAKFLVQHLKITSQEAHALVDQYRAEGGLIEKDDSFTVRGIVTESPKLERLFALSQELMRPDLEIVQEYMDARGVSYETLRKLQVGFLPGKETHWVRDSLVFPYIYSGHVVGIRYRDINSNKGGEPGAHFTLWGIDDLDNRPDVVVVVEGESDRVVTTEHLGNLAVVLSTPTCTFRKEWAREFEAVRQVILVPQSDEASLKLVQAAKSHLSNVTVVALPWRRRQIGKDIADWMRYHPAEDLQILVESAIESSSRRILSTSEFRESASKKRKWLINGLLARRQIGIIAGPPKAMKTWSALNLVRTLVSPGEEFLGIPGFFCDEDRPQNVLFIEEEGDIEEFYQRAELVLQGTDWEKYTFWGHQLGFKFDVPDWIDRLQDEIEKKNIDVLLVDPFQRTHSADENDSGEMGTVWNAIASLLTRFKNLSIIILHHFNKSGMISDKWNAFRGSSRTAGEVDLGIFIERRPKSDGTGIRLAIDGRSIVSPTDAQGNDIMRFDFPGDGRFYLVN